MGVCKSNYAVLFEHVKALLFDGYHIQAIVAASRCHGRQSRKIQNRPCRHNRSYTCGINLLTGVALPPRGPAATSLAETLEQPNELEQIPEAKGRAPRTQHNDRVRAN
jgi:hypothetical protein